MEKVKCRGDDFIACVHCGVSILERRFTQVPVSGEHALTIACTECFERLPAEELARPELPDYMRDSATSMSSYKDSVLFMKGVMSVAPPFFLQQRSVHTTHDGPNGEIIIERKSPTARIIPLRG
jgi:hypothetical protein